MEANWNSGMDYGFSVIRASMRLVSVWPLQKNDIICTFHWIVIFIMQCLVVIHLVIEFFRDCGDNKDRLDVFLILETTFHGWINILFARIYMKKIAINVTSAIDDWSTSSKEKQSYLIMTGYARIGRVISAAQLMIGLIAGIVYSLSIFNGNTHKVVTIGNETIVLWNFLVPATCLTKGISYSTYKLLYLTELVQSFFFFTAECANDSFFFAITMHLSGQLELLRIRFVELVENKTYERNHYRNMLGSWIRRHYKLIILAGNIEDVFNLNILIRLLIITIVTAVSGTRIIVSFEHHEYINVGKSFIFVQFYLLQSFLFTHAGETLQKQSESIVSTIYSTAWYKLPPSVVKDLIFIMIRSKVPLQISAGKFFYITRGTTTDILKAAMTYISFLQVQMKQ